MACSLKNMYQKIKKELPKEVKLVVVSKTRTNDEILNIYNQGQKIFGENRCEEMARKHNKLPIDIEWHMIGHLQSRKVKNIASFVSLIHSVDSLKLLKTINKEAKKNNRVINCLLQIKIAEEDTKYGLSLTETEILLKSKDFSDLDYVKIIGIMGMATYSDNKTLIQDEYRDLNKTFRILKENHFTTATAGSRSNNSSYEKNKNYFKEISAGMSGNYKIAMSEGSTIVRIGTSIFE